MELKLLGLGFNVRFFLHLHAHLKILITLRLQNTSRSAFYHFCRQIASIFGFIYRAELLVTRAKRRRLVKKASACQTFQMIMKTFLPHSLMSATSARGSRASFARLNPRFAQRNKLNRLCCNLRGIALCPNVGCVGNYEFKRNPFLTAISS